MTCRFCLLKVFFITASLSDFFSKLQARATALGAEAHEIVRESIGLLLRLQLSPEEFVTRMETALKAPPPPNLLEKLKTEIAKSSLTKIEPGAPLPSSGSSPAAPAVVPVLQGSPTLPPPFGDPPLPPLPPLSIPGGLSPSAGNGERPISPLSVPVAAGGAVAGAVAAATVADDAAVAVDAASILPRKDSMLASRSPARPPQESVGTCMSEKSVPASSSSSDHATPMRSDGLASPRRSFSMPSDRDSSAYPEGNNASDDNASKRACDPDPVSTAPMELGPNG
jgi:hypothetical protein